MNVTLIGGSGLIGKKLTPLLERAGHSVTLASPSRGVDAVTGQGLAQAQETLIKDGKVPYTIVRVTQFFEFLKAIADAGAGSEAVHVSSALFQPIAADDVAHFLAGVVAQAPRNGVVEFGGPERLPMHLAVQRVLDAHQDARRVVADPQALYFGSLLDDQSLVAPADAEVGAITLDAWLAKVAASGAR